MPTVSFDLGLSYFAMFSILSASKSNNTQTVPMCLQPSSYPDNLEDIANLKIVNPQIRNSFVFQNISKPLQRDR